MKSLPSLNRRDFLKSAAAGAATLTMSAASHGRVLGANERISLGMIGCGQRGFSAHMPGVKKHASAENVEITAVCDVWTEHLDRAAAQAKESYGSSPRKFRDYEELLARKDVDAVMIATPDFQHSTQLEAAARAGKDTYCEKPLAMNMEELKSACDAVKESGILVQIGTQMRSYPGVVGSKKLYETGALGSLSRVEQFRNSSRPNWYKRLVRLPVRESEVHWRGFLLNKPHRPFSDRLFAGWFGYREFCSGSIGQFMSHFIDLVHYVTGARLPASAVAQGKTFIWDDDYHFDCPDHVETTLIYPEGFMVSFCTNFGNGSGNRTVLYGTHGVLDITDRNKPVVSGAGAAQKGSLGAESLVEHVDCPDHFLNWLQCLRSRKQPVAPIEAGYHHGVACILSDRAYETGRRQVYDPETREIREG